MPLEGPKVYVLFDKSMPLPQQIPVRYTEEEAGYVSVRPVVKQVFRLHELADMVVSIAGKDIARVQQIFRIGTAVYHGYRYWWDGIEAEASEVATLLAPFPDDNPSLPFEPSKATAVLLEIGGGAQCHVVEILREEALQTKFLGRLSPWQVLLQSAASHTARYEKYSHARRADLFRISLPYDQAQQLVAALLEAAPRSLRHRWSTLHPPAAITFVCPRS
ncbi:MAG TPA: hypothetical protein VFB10_02805 [Candidatus Dormibacteraeota bacterium]|nr:hypothetical protein [Candidatus Dormibacteraeota bacterium]